MHHSPRRLYQTILVLVISSGCAACALWVLAVASHILHCASMNDMGSRLTPLFGHSDLTLLPMATSLAEERGCAYLPTAAWLICSEGVSSRLASPRPSRGRSWGPLTAWAAGDAVTSSTGPFVIQSAQNTTHCFAISHVSPVGCGMNLAACQARAPAAIPSGKPALVCGYAVDLVPCDTAAPAEKLFAIVGGTLYSYALGFYLNFLQARARVRACDFSVNAA